MKKFKILSIFSVLMLSFMFAFTGCGSDSDKNKLKNLDSSKVLVVYFSATGTTRKVAEFIQSATGGDIYQIVPKEEYTSNDLNYSDSNSRATLEQKNSDSRPEIGSEEVSGIEEYDIIFLGYPIWWRIAPKIIYTFLESYNLSGKTVVPFCTSGSTEIKGSVSELKKIESDAMWLSGARFSKQTTQSDIDDWLDKLK